MSSTIDYETLKQEVVEYLRNSDVLSTSVRGVTTVTDSGNTVGTPSTLQLLNTGVKNVRSVTINAVLLTRFTDYTVDYDAASNTCVITFTVPLVDGESYSVDYDYGSDKIFADMPRNDLTINSFPRVAVDIIGDSSQDIGLGAGSKLTTLSFSIYVYDFKTKNIDAKLTLIKNAMLSHQKSFYYQRYVNRINTSGLQLFTAYGETKIMFKSVDYLSSFNIETA